MAINILRLAIAVFSLACTTASYAGESTKFDTTGLQGLGDTRQHVIESRILGQDYFIFVRLPEEYDQEQSSYPTVYLLDGGITFPILAAYSHYLRLAEDLPPLIIVGISYGTDHRQKGNMRGRDFTAPAPDRESYGGAGKFQTFLRDELFPLIESSYRSDSTDRHLMGQSLGGQFVIHAAMFAPDLFRGYIASNPALHRNVEFFLDPESVVATKRGRRPQLFVSIADGDDARFREPASRWLDFWQGRESRTFDLEVRMFEDNNHMSPAPQAFRHGLMWTLGSTASGH
jgi:predicted alpha/beta superfamily hydrolase